MKRFLFLYKAVFLGCRLFFTGFLFISLFFSSSAGTSEENDKVHICFFELDNTRTSQNFGKREGVEIHRYQIGGNENGKQAFENMIKEGHKCDGLIFSGHHTGDWFGKTGTLWLKDMEALSCKYRDWFKNIKALWLDGCNTVTDNSIQSSGTVKTPDSETVRVVGKEEDKTTLDRHYIEDYQQSYSASLDQNTPLSSRYLRMFPNTQIYGFNGAAPEGKDKGKSSFIFNHLTKLGKALKAEATGQDLKNDFKRGLKALFYDDLCDPEKIKAWEEAGYKELDMQGVEHHNYRKAYKLGCDLILAKQVLDNPNSDEAQKSLAHWIKNDPKYKNKRDILNLANRILKQPTSKDAIELAKKSIVSTLNAINKADEEATAEKHKYSHLLFNNIYDTWNTAKQYKKRDSDFFNDVKSELTTDTFTNSIRERIKSPHTASLRKGDYIKFYTEVHDIDIHKTGDTFVKEHIAELLAKAKKIFPDLKSPRQTDLDFETKRVLAISVVDQLLQYNLLSKAQIKDLLANKKLLSVNTENPFIADTSIRLKFTADKTHIVPTVKNGQTDSIAKRRAIRIGAGIYLNRFYNNSSKASKQAAKDQLEKLMEEVDMDEVEEHTDSYAFFRALHLLLAGQTDQERVGFLLDLSRNTGDHLEEAVIKYADANLKAKNTRKAFCEKLKDEFSKEEREGYMFNDCL